MRRATNSFVILCSSVSMLPRNVSLWAGAQQQFTATVYNATDRTVAWSLAGSGCTGSGCGSITQNGLYTAPTPVPAAMQATIVATATADTTKSASAAANLVPVSVSLTPPTASVYQRDMTQFMPTIDGTNDRSLTWSINGMIFGGCSTGYILPTGFNAGLYTTAMCDIYNPPQTFTITATSNADPTKSGAAQVTVTGPSPYNSLINGNYAFLFRGYDLDGPVAIAGRITADGSGGMYAGVVQMNRASNTVLMSASGNYSILADGRGTMSLAGYLFRFVLDSTGKIHIVEFDQTMNNPIRGTGEMKRQDASAFVLNAINGQYVLELGGDLNGSPMALLSSFSPDKTGVLHASMDVAMPSGNIGGVSVDGALMPPDSQLGFGSMNLSPAGLPMATPLNLTYFIVSANEAYIAATDARGSAVPMLSGRFIKQSGIPLSTGSLSTPTIMELYGLGSTPGSHVIAAQAVFDGAGSLSGVADENQGGNISTALAFTGTYSISSIGRGTANLLFNGGSSTAFTFYMLSPGQASVLAGSPGGSIGEVLTGTIEEQVGGPFSLAALAGGYAVCTLPPSTTNVAGISGVVTLASDGAFARVHDVCVATGCYLGESLSGNLTLTDTASGRGFISMDMIAPPAFYVVSPKKILVLDSATPGDTAARLEVLQQ